MSCSPTIPRIRAILLACTLLAATSSASLAAVGKDFSKCQKLIGKGTQTLSKGSLGVKTACAADLVACRVADETGGAAFAACAAPIVAKCTDKLAKAALKGEAKIAKGVNGKSCSALSATQRKARFSGIGFRDVEQSCEALSHSITTKAALGDCLAAAMRCREDRLLQSVVPRAYEVMNDSGLLAAVPTGSFSSCLEPRPPSPAAPATPLKEVVRCQSAFAKNASKTAKVLQKRVLKCTDAYLACTIGEERGELSTAAAAASCRSKADTKCDKQLAKLAGDRSKRDLAIDEACGPVGLADLGDALGFELTCPSAATGIEVRQCASQSADAQSFAAAATGGPRSCGLLSDASRIGGLEDLCLPYCGNGVVEDGESCDDGNRDGLDGCNNVCVPGPVDSVYTSIPSAAVPANTPDGTPLNAVAPGSTLETQFGSTIFDLNNATYVRYFGVGAGDPDAVLVMVPGFAAGAQSFKIFAETMIDKAAQESGFTLEVWAFDRRTNQLEDLSGVIQAEDELDPLLGLDWFFGAEVGLSLDARLSRRAVFHDGADVAFLANFTPNVFARDIDAVVEAAIAAPGAPSVFLGGHSLGTTFTARYAATDFDTAAGVEAGYAKLAGLVLMEGGALFGSAATATPSDDELDLIIARADGGLYNAVASGAASCTNGLPCTSNADCALVAPTTGALTSKCVGAVEAYTGADQSGTPLVTPQIQAAGDITAIQGRVAPDSPVIVQEDFGAGSAVEVVGGLGLLGLLAPSTTEAALGLFLDDDFSPQPAFRVSMGYTNNGANVQFPGLDFVIAARSGFDPAREWVNAGEPMPTLATPDNGPISFSPSVVHGLEVEVTPIENMFALIRAGQSNFGDWYFASSGLSVTNGLGGLDSAPLSVGRGRPDIENMTLASSIDIPVIAIGGTNGLTPTNGSFKAVAEAIGPCTAPSCTGTTARVLNPVNVQTVYGGPDGGFEVHLSVGYAHVDVLTAPDDPLHNNVYAPLLAFLLRNTP